jgi:site-specific DNA-methyltransferase (cytosine-N4-specific)
VTHLTWHDYRYYPYERELAVRELAAVLSVNAHSPTSCGLRLEQDVDAALARRLTYFSGTCGSAGFLETVQGQLERVARSGRNRQATRYSAHGLHEYKGKFNPQVARAVLNIFGVEREDLVFDPFCGSGTALLESAHLGAIGFGTDPNPLAVFLANTKLQCLATPASQLVRSLQALEEYLTSHPHGSVCTTQDPRRIYLQSWFDPAVLAAIEHLRLSIEEVCGQFSPIFLAVSSDLLRDYSLQDPCDLRIRRRVSPLPEEPFLQAFLLASRRLVKRIEATQRVLGLLPVRGKAVVSDVRALKPIDAPGIFEAGITSPPYATALPYVDTQRLSLVWLGLIPPEEIAHLEGLLIGSREVRKKEMTCLRADLESNRAGLPPEQAKACVELARAVGRSDGFRRQAVPALLYRYLTAMRDSFQNIAKLVRPNGPLGVIVGCNHTVLSGVRRDINTPMHLAELAASVGWVVDELISLQTYQRYGLHSANAVESETLILLRNGNPRPITSREERLAHNHICGSGVDARGRVRNGRIPDQQG